MRDRLFSGTTNAVVLACLWILLFVLNPYRMCTAQQRLSGRVVTVDSVPVSNATVRLMPSDDSSAVSFVSTNDSGYFSFLLTAKEEETMPSGLRLEQNYPNPFFASTIFTYTLPAATPLTLDVYDYLGRHVRALVSGHHTAGTHRCAWNGTGNGDRPLSYGAYVVALRTPHGIRSRVVMLASTGRMGAIQQSSPAPPVAHATALLTRTATYRLDVLDTVVAQPRFQSKSLSLDVGQRDTAVTVIVEYGGWEDLEFPALIAKRLFVDGPYLYVCAWKYGLWRRNVVSREPWEYLGLGDTSVRVGVRDVDAYGDRLLVAYDGRTNTVFHPDSVVSLWRSTDSGKHWSEADSSINTILVNESSYPNVVNALSIIKRSPHRQNTLLALIDMATGILRSDDGGISWRMLRGSAAPSMGGSDGWWNTNIQGLLYVQYTGMDAGRMSGYSDYGDTLLYTIDQSFADMTFLDNDPTAIYATLGYLYSSTNNGMQWSKVIDSIPSFVMLAKHPARNTMISNAYKTIAEIDPSNRSCRIITKLPFAVSSNLVVCPASGRMYFTTGNRIIAIQLH